MGYRQDLEKKIKRLSDHPRHHNVTMQAHHVLSKSGLTISKLKTKLKLAGYDIDTVKNLVFIPSTLQGACHLVVQLHRGNHSNIDPEGERGTADDDDEQHSDSYHEMVGDLIQEKFKNFNICKLKEKQVKAKMNNLSLDVLKSINNFSVALTSIAKTFKTRMPGCRGADTVDQSNKNVNKPCPVKRDHEKKTGRPSQGRGQRRENITIAKKKRKYSLKVGR